MGTYYRWSCDERREYFDPGEILGPKCPQGGYGVKANSIPHSAWVVGALMTERWRGCRVRLVGDYGDDYDCDGYEEVSQHVLRYLVHAAPDEALRFLVGKVRRAEGGTLVDESSSAQEEDERNRDEYLKILAEHAREDWPPRCEEEDCLNFGERHPGDHVPVPPVSEPEQIRRQYFMGLGRGEASPGEEISLMVEAQDGFAIDNLVFSEDTRCFVVLRISVGGVEVPIMSNVSAALFGGGLPLHCMIKPCQKIVVVLRNESNVRAKIVGAVIGTVVTKNPKWSSNG